MNRSTISTATKKSALSSYLNDISKVKGLTKAKERTLTARMASGDQKAEKMLLEAKLELVVAKLTFELWKRINPSILSLNKG